MANQYDDFEANQVGQDSTNRISTLPVLPISKANAIAQGYLRCISTVADEDDEEARYELGALVDRIVLQKEQSGDADDFHNFAVSLARKDEYGLACRVIECGLKLHPKCVDLLADYLQYGVSGSKQENCMRYYIVLMKIPHMLWTWRGFSFSVEFLSNLLEQSDSEKDIDEKKKEMLSLVADFRKFYPYSEESYRTEAGIYRSLCMPDKELGVLREAMETLKVCPKCSLRCADILFDRGNYAEAMKAIHRGIDDATQTQASVNEGYIYYLSALCKIAVPLKENKTLVKEAVLDIYSDFDIAIKELGNNSSYSDVIKSKTNTLLKKYGVDIPEAYDSLIECIL